MKEPQTDQQFIEALNKLGCEVIDTGNRFIVRSRKGGQTALDAEDYSSALFEAWNLMKP